MFAAETVPLATVFAAETVPFATVFEAETVPFPIVLPKFEKALMVVFHAYFDSDSWSLDH